MEKNLKYQEKTMEINILKCEHMHIYMYICVCAHKHLHVVNTSQRDSFVIKDLPEHKNSKLRIVSQFDASLWMSSRS